MGDEKPTTNHPNANTLIGTRVDASPNMKRGDKMLNHMLPFAFIKTIKGGGKKNKKVKYYYSILKDGPGLHFTPSRPAHNNKWLLGLLYWWKLRPVYRGIFVSELGQTPKT